MKNMKSDVEVETPVDPIASVGVINAEFMARTESFSFAHSFWRPGFIVNNHISIKKEHLNLMIDVLKGFGSINHADTMGWYFCITDDFVAMLDDGANDFHTYVFVMATPEKLEAFDLAAHAILKSEERDDDYPINIDYYMIDQRKDIRSSDFQKWTSDFKYLNDKLYPRINVSKMLKAFLLSEETILILTGIPGTGKTSLIKHILVEFAPHVVDGDELSAAYVKDEEILHDTQFWNKLTDVEYDIIIFDDLDDALSPREKNENNGFINNLLSHSDGVFDNKSKFIITTNREIEEIDPALIRPGRCFDMLDMPPLSREEALSLWKEEFGLSDEAFVRCFAELATISQAHIVSEAKREEIGNNKDYLTDQSISIRSTFLKKKRGGPGFL